MKIRLSRQQKVITVFIVSFVIIIGFFYFRHLESERHRFKVVFLNIGQGDAALIQFENGQKMLVDCGPDRTILSALGRNLPFYDRKIDIVLVTHPDLDHYGGCLDVLKNYQVGEIITNGRGKPDDSYWREWDRIANESKAVMKTINGHEIMNVASSSLEFFSPDPDLDLPVKSFDSNNFSIVFRLVHSAQAFLFTADMEELLERVLAKKYCDSIPSSAQKEEQVISSCRLAAGILKAGHHGSDGSSSEYFLQFVEPKVAVISVGKNKFGHPSLRAIRHLERAGARILRTDISGDITFH